MSLTTFDLPIGSADVLALGGWLKCSVCAVRGTTAFVTDPVGDLVDADSCEKLEMMVENLLSDLRVGPAVVVHDLHPDFFSTRLALRISGQMGIPALGVQHHHAHVAAVCAEHSVAEPVLGLGMDGVGLGTDGQAWGGELLRVDGAGFEPRGQGSVAHGGVGAG